MKIFPEYRKVKAEKWARYRYNLSNGLGENGQRLTGSAEHIALSRRAAAEGMVLLKNNGLLPLKDGTVVALFGVGSLESIYCGGGAGEVYPAYVRSIYDGFLEKAPRIQVYEPVTRFYYDYAAPLINTLGMEEILEEPDVPLSLIHQAAAHAQVAVIVIHRYSTEGKDRLAEKGDFYLTDREQQLICDVTAAFPHSIAVLNIGGVVDVRWIKDNPRLDGALLEWQAGMEGGSTVADILCGDVNPSGKLVDTFATSFADYPASDTFHESDDYVTYYEDIYVGYRYFETIPGAKERVQYPFGFGLSYTSFAFSKPVAVQTADRIEVSLSVTNTGTLAGKEVVQVYYTAPQGKLGKSAICLAAFQKTRLLAPGECQDITLSFPITDMASYDDLGKCQKSAYILEQGQYRFFAGNSCRDLQECDYRYEVTQEFLVTAQLQQRCAPRDIDRRLRSDGSFEPLPSFPAPATAAPVIQEPPLRESEKPHYLRAVANGVITLDEFMEQLTNDELIALLGGVPNRGVAGTGGWGGPDRLRVYPVMTVDGPAGVRLRPIVGIPTTAWPCATQIACTWDPELIYAIGVAGGMECKENGLATWLTPALNIHRNPLCGRNFEYFSEDPLIAGKFAAAKVRGIQSTHTAPTPKHFAANNKETNRFYSDSRMSERALREIYLRGFEICVKESAPWAIMSSYNLINGQRVCECAELLTDILRGEWGFDGMVTTDWDVPCDQANCVLAGNDIRMRQGRPEDLVQALADGRIHRGHLMICAKRILEMILKLD